MHRYFPHNQEEIKEMLATLNLTSLDQLFDHLPDDIKLREHLQIPDGLSEHELLNFFEERANENRQLTIFRGAGVYDRIIPSVIASLISRQEFLTAYTPYQPEVSQGTLHYIFEFQSMIAELTGMDVANASVYDGATATAEAMFVACLHTKKNRIAVAKNINPRTLMVLQTYAKYRDIELVIINDNNGVIELENFKQQYRDDFAGFIIQSPNYYGLIEDCAPLFEFVHQSRGLSIVNVNPTTLAILKAPSEYGADIAIGEGQTLGLPMNFGGPYLGFMATKSELIRKLPGRIVGMSEDHQGRRGFVLTFQAREQHIRREKANSNICSNQSLMALSATIYLALLGEKGLKDVAMRSYQGAHYLFNSLLATKKFKSVYPGSFFDEFVVETTIEMTKIENVMKENNILGGLPIDHNKLLFAVTEKRSKEEIDHLISLLEGI